MKKALLTLLVFLVFTSLVFAEDTDQESNASQETVKIKNIIFIIEGNTRQDYLRQNFIIKENTEYSLSKLKSLLEIQFEYLARTNLFSFMDIEFQENEDGYDLLVYLKDSLYYSFSFVPFDAIAKIKHLEGGNELLTIRAGYNTQSLSYDRPNIYKMLSYYASFSHYYGNYDSYSKMHEVNLEARLYLATNIWSKTGLKLSYEWYKILSYNQQGHFIKTSVYSQIFPYIPMTKPVSSQFDLEIGMIFEIGKHPGLYFDIIAKLLYKPLDFLSFEIKSKLNYTTENVSVIFYPSTSDFRSPESITRKNIFNYNAFELKFDDVLSFEEVLGLSFTPLFYLEAASSGYKFKSFDSYKYSLGGGVILGFLSPVDLKMTFAVMWGINRTSPAFLFECKTSIY